MRTILITNDDGIRADGLLRLVRAATAFGQVWVISPDRERSAASHSITLDRPLDLYPVSYPVEAVHAFSCSGTPADCVRVGCHGMLPRRPDLVLSGINYGYNSASDLQYSATAGAALEAAFQGVPAIALSEGPHPRHEVTDHYLPQVLERLVHRPLTGHRIWNVNFPAVPLQDCRGLLEERTVSEWTFYQDHYELVEPLQGGGKRLRVVGIPQTQAKEEEVGTDFRAILDGYVSIGVVRNLG